MSGCRAKMLGEMMPMKHAHFQETILDRVTRKMIMATSVNGVSHLMTRQAHNIKNDAAQRAVFHGFEMSSWLLAAIMPNRKGTPHPTKLCRIQLAIS